MCSIIHPFMNQISQGIVLYFSLILFLQDLPLLEKLIQDDIASAKMPVALIAYAGKEYHVTNIFVYLSFCYPITVR